MGEYQSCMGGSSGGLDPRTKYQIQGNQVLTLGRPDGLFIFFKKWPVVATFVLGENTKVVTKDSKSNGSGTIRLENPDRRSESFWIYGKFDKFVSELEINGLRLSNTLF